MAETPDSLRASAPGSSGPVRQHWPAWAWLIAIAAIGVVGYFAYQRFWPPAAQAPARAPAGKSAPGALKGGGPIPVVAATARKGDVDIYINGLGTVTPLRTVTVRSRVEGQLMRVHFQEGQVVKEGQLLAEIDPRPFEVQRKQAEGQLARDQALLANARLDVERYRTLLAQDSIAKQQVDAQESLVRQYEGVVRSDQSQVENARLQLTYARITAPISGRTGLRLVDPGNIVRGGDTTGIVVITQVTPIAVLFTVPQDALPEVVKRMQSGDPLPVEAWDREQKRRLASGTLTAVDNLVDTATGTVKLKASFANDDSSLFPNQFVNVRMKLDTATGQTIIPSAAIQRGGQGMFAYVVRDDDTVTARAVKLGPIDGQRVAITAGIKPGERVVVDGIDRLREGARVEVTKRPEFKPSVDGTSGVRKGKGKGKGRRSAESQDGKAAPGADGAAAKPDSAEGEKKGRRRRDKEGGDAKGVAPAPETAGEATEAPRKGSRRRRAESQDGKPSPSEGAPPQ
jgi:multidrug efflux system membrane fusion protein